MKHLRVTPFLMHRVELKGRGAGRERGYLFMFLMHRVELKVYIVASKVDALHRS